jgi:hypothetical protein
MLRMVSYPHRPLSGHITCYFNRTYHVLPTLNFAEVDSAEREAQTWLDSHKLSVAAERQHMLDVSAITHTHSGGDLCTIASQ